jgi:hypothetical protein
MPGNDLYLDSAILASLRAFVMIRPALQQVAGPIAQFKVVIDANMAVSDLVRKYRNPNLRMTAVEEVVKSSAMEVHAPTWLEEEMT